MTLDLVIKGGKVVTASDVGPCDVGVKDGRIVALGEHLSGAAREIDASGKLVMPGGIDSHVHLAQPSGPGIVMADGFESGTRSAAAGGNTTILSFACRSAANRCARASSATIWRPRARAISITASI